MSVATEPDTEPSSAVTTFKFIVQENGKLTGDIRRLNVRSPTSLNTVRLAVKDILGWDDAIYRFTDEDGDVVTIGSQHELDTAIALANGGPVRLVISKASDSAVFSAPKPAAAEAPASKPAAAEASAPKPAAAEAPAPEPAPAMPSVPNSSFLLDSAPNATIPENIMIQFSAIAEFFQRMAQQMAEFAPRIPVIVNDGLRKMSESMHNDINPLDVSVSAARNAPAESSGMPKDAPDVVVHRLPETVVHPGVECAHCHKKPLTGMRYKCIQCECDLCQDCVFTPGVHTEGHKFLPVCAPAVGSHFVNSASKVCNEVKTRAAPVVGTVKNVTSPVVQSVKAAVDDAVATVRSKSAEISNIVKEQVDTVKEVTEVSSSESLTDKQRAILQQLKDMGFHDEKQLIPLIRKYKELSAVIEHLIA